MADTRMSLEEREAFLADLHIGVLSVPRSAGPNSLKGRLLRHGLALTLVAQSEDLPYAYVSVEGMVTDIRPSCDDDAEIRSRRVSDCRRQVRFRPQGERTDKLPR